MTQRAPLVSIVITTFNHRLYIREAVLSALGQTYARREVVVVDDGSSDGTADLLDDLKDECRIIRQANAGVAGSRNRGVAESRGHLVAFMDGDDRWHPDKLTRQVDAFLQHPEAGLIACDIRVFDGDHILRESPMTRRVGRAAETADVLHGRYLDEMITENLIPTTSQVMVPKAVLDAVGPSDTTMPVASDYDLYLRIAERYPFTLLLIPLADWRYVRSSASGPISDRTLRWAPDMIQALRNLRGRLPDAKRRNLVTQSIRHHARQAAGIAYYERDRLGIGSARAILATLASSTGHDRLIWMYLAASYAPAPVRRLASRFRRVLPAAPQGDSKTRPCPLTVRSSRRSSRSSRRVMK